MAKAKRAKKPSGKGVLYVRGIPNDVKAEFKAACAILNVSMVDKITELMKDTIRHAIHRTAK